jgi:hypothetical protein
MVADEHLVSLGPIIRDAMDRANNLMMDTDDTRFEVGLGYIWDALRAVLNLIEAAERDHC